MILFLEKEAQESGNNHGNDGDNRNRVGFPRHFSSLLFCFLTFPMLIFLEDGHQQLSSLCTHGENRPKSLLCIHGRTSNIHHLILLSACPVLYLSYGCLTMAQLSSHLTVNKDPWVWGESAFSGSWHMSFSTESHCSESGHGASASLLTSRGYYNQKDSSYSPLRQQGPKDRKGKAGELVC